MGSPTSKLEQLPRIKIAPKGAIFLAFSKHYSSSCHIIRRQFYFDTVTHEYLNSILSHTATDMAQNGCTLRDPDPKHCIG
jgi:hypothetical protein